MRARVPPRPRQGRGRPGRPDARGSSAPGRVRPSSPDRRAAECCRRLPGAVSCASSIRPLEVVFSSITRAPTVSRRPCTCPSFPSCASSSSFSRVARCAPSCSSCPCSRSRRSLRAHGLRPGGAPGWCSRIEAVARSRARGRSPACRAIRGPAAAWWNHRPANQPALRPSVSIRRAVASDGQPADAGMETTVLASRPIPRRAERPPDVSLAGGQAQYLGAPAGYVRGPLVHQPAALLEQVRPCVAPLDVGPDPMRQRHLADGVRHAGPLGGQVRNDERKPWTVA